MPAETSALYLGLRNQKAGQGPVVLPVPVRKTAPLPLMWFNDIEPCLDAKDFVQGLLTEGGASVAYGESNAGKTFLITDLALCVAAGIDWMGLRVEQGPVAYCVLEGGQGFKNRVHAWRQAKGLEGEPIQFLAIPESLNLLDADADTPRLIDALAEAKKVTETPFKLIVIDTLSRAMAGGNENASEDMGALVQNMDAIRAATGAHVLWIHHSGKDAAKGARGHSLLRAAVDTEIEVTTDEDGGQRLAKVVKQREMAKGATFPFKLDVHELGENRHGEQVTTCVVAPLTGDEAKPSGRSRLSGDPRQAFDILNDLMAAQGAPDYPGVAPGFPSVPEDWWREQFYQRAKPGATPEVRRQAFRRAADKLVSLHAVSLNKGRVWITW